jgi:soluble lytic murein transglycosylase-like protein
MTTSRLPWMSKLLNLSVPAILLASAFGADSPLSEAETPPEQGPEVCQVAVLRNGFTIQYLRREVAGPATRLWLCGDPGAGYAEIASQQIDRFEESRDAVRLAPAAPASVPDTTASGTLPVEHPFRNLIASAASLYQIDPDFVASVVKAESGFNPTAVSPKGAQGLMQLMPGTAARLGAGDVFDPAANLGAGTKYLRQLLDQFAGDAVKALAAYNAGPQTVEQYGGIPPYRETRAYVTRIIEDYNRKKLQQQANSPAAPAVE